MIIIFSSENDLSTLEVAKRLKYMGLEVYIINPEENVFKFSHINSNGIYFYHHSDFCCSFHSYLLFCTDSSILIFEQQKMTSFHYSFLL